MKNVLIFVVCLVIASTATPLLADEGVFRNSSWTVQTMSEQLGNMNIEDFKHMSLGQFQQTYVHASGSGKAWIRRGQNFYQESIGEHGIIFQSGSQHSEICVEVSESRRKPGVR